MTRILFSVVSMLALANLSGCALPGVLKLGKDEYAEATPKNPVVRIIGMWQPGEGPGLDGKTKRGFIGQVLFFTRGSNLAAHADGQVEIFVFDDQGTPEQQVEPITNYTFKSGAWNQFMATGALGASYDVFLPYTREGMNEAKCMIRIRYTPKQGPPVNSEMINVVLPGVKKKNVEGAAGEANPPAVTEEVRTPRNSHPGPAVGQKIPTPQEIQDMIARRPRAVDLDERERQRIIREARQRLAAEGRDEVSLADWDTAEQGGNMPNATSASQNRGRVRHQAGALSSESASPDGERPTVPEAGWLGDPNAGERRDPHPEEESDF